MRSLLRLGALFLAGMLFLVGPQSVDPAEAAASYREKKVLRMVNRVRANRGRVRLRMHSTTRNKAHRHSERMAADGTIYHSSCLSCMAPSGWSIVGENVAKATTLRGAHRALMNSTPHRRNILNRRFRKAGMGVVRRGGYFYITQVFFAS